MRAAIWNGTVRRAFVFFAAAVMMWPTSSARSQTVAAQENQMPLPIAVEGQETPASSAMLPEASQPSQTPIADTYEAPPWVLFPAEPVPDYGFVIDYRARAFCGSVMSYEFINPNVNPNFANTPWSKLRFPLNSTWQGFQTGIEKPEWAVHVEWMTAMAGNIQGTFCDYDWDPPNANGTFTDLGVGDLRWNEAQSINLDAECKGSDTLLGLPVEVWQVFGFRWQRLDVTTYDMTQVLEGNQPVAIPLPGDVITYNQQYYTAYLGVQLRKAIPIGSKEIRLTFQADWGLVWGYGIDYHILREFYAINSTHGSSSHLGLTAEVPMSQRLSLGVQGDVTQIRTTGSVWEEFPAGTTAAWGNGVGAGSDQTSFTAFVRLHY